MLGQQIGAEDVVDRAGHGEDKRAVGVAVETAANLGRLGEHGDGLFSFRRQGLAGAIGRKGPGQSA